MERWVPLREYPGYSVSDLGRFRNDNSGVLLRTTEFEHRRSYIGLMKDGIQVKRSPSKIVAETFLPKPKHPSFTTAIHFDGDFGNCRADNLDWRPRWFAIRHAEQFRKEMPEYPQGVRDIKTGELYNDAWAVVFQFGLLFMDVVISISNKTYVFPTMQTFEWI